MSGSKASNFNKAKRKPTFATTAFRDNELFFAFRCILLSKLRATVLLNCEESLADALDKGPCAFDAISPSNQFAFAIAGCTRLVFALGALLNLPPSQSFLCSAFCFRWRIAAQQFPFIQARLASKVLGLF